MNLSFEFLAEICVVSMEIKGAFNKMDCFIICSCQKVFLYWNHACLTSIRLLYQMDMSPLLCIQLLQEFCMHMVVFGHRYYSTCMYMTLHLNLK